MSSLLRSTKFVRYFTGAARTLILNSAKTAEANLLINPKALCASNNVLTREYATSKKNEKLEPLLQRLDSEVRRFGRITKKDIDEVFDEIRSKSDITSSQSLLVIRCCGELVPEELPEQRTLLVQKIWGVLAERGIPMDISHYNALLRVYIENEHAFSPAKFLEELERKGLQPNRVTYQRLMWRYCQEGDVEGATKVLERMRELKLPVSEPVLNALVMGHAFHGDTDGAKAVLETMAAAGLQPTNRTYTLLACGYAKQGDIQNIESTIKTAIEKDIYMTDKDILDIIEHLAIVGHDSKIEQLIPHLQKGHGYNQDVCNFILRLLNKGNEETAKKMLKTMPKVSTSEDTPFKGAFFVKHLIKIDKSAEAIVKTCRELQDEGVVPKALYIAAETALNINKPELAQKLFKELQKDGLELRQHYYWPLLAQKGKDGDEEGLLQILRDMDNEGFVPTGEALRDYVIPYLIKKDTPENIIIKLQIANVPITHSARNVMLELLESGNIKKAADIALQYRPRGQYSLISRPLVGALNKTKDIESFVTILHVISSQPSINVEEDSANDETQKDDTKSKEVGRIVKIAVKNLVQPDLCKKLLVAVHSKGLSINTAYAEEIEQFLGQNMTTDLSELLSQLTSSELEAVPLENTRPRVRSAAQLESLLAQIKSNGGNNVNRITKQLFEAYIKENNVEKLSTYLEELESNKFELSNAMLAQLVEFYSQNDNIDKALEAKAQIAKKDPEFVLNKLKTVLLAYGLVRANRYDEAVKLLKENKPNESEGNGFLLNSKVWQMLNTLAELKEDSKVLEMTKLLIENNYIEPSNVILGPSIKVHLLKNDIESALQQFENCCKQYRSTPWKGELMKSLILKEDATKLQWLADLSTQIHGEVNILHDLVLAFIECGRLRQARRILETPGLHTRQKRLDDACQRYVSEGKPEFLEGLLEATKELSHIDRSNIFYHLLVSYCKADETDKALGLWTILQEEGEIPSDHFLIYLGKHLKSKNREVPFIIPNKQESDNKLNEKIIEKTPTPKKAPTKTKKDVSMIIENMIQQGEAAQAMDYAVKCIGDGIMPQNKVLKFLLKNLAEDGNVEKIQLLGKHLNELMKRSVTYDDKLTLAIFRRGAGFEHVDGVLKALQVANTDEDVERALRKFPRSSALDSAVQNDELSKKCHEIACLSASKGFFLPANLIWMEYILAGAKSLWCVERTDGNRSFLWIFHEPSITENVQRPKLPLIIQEEPEHEQRVEDLIQRSSNVVANIDDITLKEPTIPENQLLINDGFGEMREGQFGDRSVEAMRAGRLDVPTDLSHNLSHNLSHSLSHNLSHDRTRLASHDAALMERISEHDITMFNKYIPEIPEIPPPDPNAPPMPHDETATELQPLKDTTSVAKKRKAEEEIVLEELEPEVVGARVRRNRRLVVDSRCKLDARQFRARLACPNIHQRCQASADDVVRIRVPAVTYFGRPAHGGQGLRSSLSRVLSWMFSRNLAVGGGTPLADRQLEEAVTKAATRVHSRSQLERIEEEIEEIAPRVETQKEMEGEGGLDVTKARVEENIDIAELPTQVVDTLSQARKRASDSEQFTKRRRTIGYVSFKQSQQLLLEASIPAQEADKENVPRNEQRPGGGGDVGAMLHALGLADVQEPTAARGGRGGSGSTETPLGSLDRTKVSLGDSERSTDSRRFIRDQWGTEATMVKILNGVKAGMKPLDVRTLVAKGPVIPGCRSIIAARCFTSVLKLKQHGFIHVRKDPETLQIVDIALGPKFEQAK
ncbi:unnamed protein product, partial [Iphiclides podalirius]